jgi:hypothetical protein
VINFDNPTLVPVPFEDGKTCPSCGSFHVMFQRRRGGRCTDAFHDIAVAVGKTLPDARRHAHALAQKKSKAPASAEASD